MQEKEDKRGGARGSRWGEEEEGRVWWLTGGEDPWWLAAAHLRGRERSGAGSRASCLYPQEPTTGEVPRMGQDMECRNYPRRATKLTRGGTLFA